LPKRFGEIGPGRCRCERSEQYAAQGCEAVHACQDERGLIRQQRQHGHIVLSVKPAHVTVKQAHDSQGPVGRLDGHRENARRHVAGLPGRPCRKARVARDVADSDRLT
jgi:hypothetical protein